MAADHDQYRCHPRSPPSGAHADRYAPRQHRDRLLCCGVLAAAIPLGRLAGIGTLFAFALVNIAVVVLRRTRPHLHRTFRVPLSPVLPALGFGFWVWTMGSVSAVIWVVFGVWTAVGLVFYFVYGQRLSRLAPPES